LSSTIVAVLARAQADRRLDAHRRLGGVAVAPAAVVAHRPPLRARFGAHLLEFLLACVAAIGVARGEHLLDDLAVALGARELADRLAVPFEPEPGEPVEDRLDRRFCGAFAVGVLDPEQEFAAQALGVEPVEQRRARAADMEEAGRGGGEARYDLRHGARF